MLIMPAIDLRNGRCVRLKQGVFADETIYAADPVVVARKWQAEGARILHIVDLDGAQTGSLANLAVIKKIIQSVDVPVQVGGGVQSMADIAKLQAIGVKTIIVGTMALENISLLQEMLEKFADTIIVSLDSRSGSLAKRGWLEQTDSNLLLTAKQLEIMGVKKFIYTNILTDGMLTEPDYAEVARLLRTVRVPVIVAGGVSSVNAIKKLAALGVCGAILGKALYEQKITLKEANNAS